MAYEKTVWQSGDTITAEKLNKLEDGVENSYNYNSDIVIKEDGWEYSYGYTTILDSEHNFAISYLQSVEEYELPISPSTTKVHVYFWEGNDLLFDGIADVGQIESSRYIGVLNTDTLSPDFSTYPFLFNIHTSNGHLNTELVTQKVGDYEIVINEVEDQVIFTPLFEKAVNAVIKANKIVKILPMERIIGQGFHFQNNETYEDIVEFLTNGNEVKLLCDSLIYNLNCIDPSNGRLDFYNISDNELYKIMIFSDGSIEDYGFTFITEEEASE